MQASGALKDPTDTRDYPFRDSHLAGIGAGMLLPGEVNYLDLMPDAKDQGPHQSCVAQAGAVAAEFWVRSKVWGFSPKLTALSARYLYLKSRGIMGTFPQDSGLYPRAAFRALQYYGMPAEYYWPEEGDLNEIPTPTVEDQALWRRISLYHRLDTASPDEIRLCLSQRHLVVLTIRVFGNLIPLWLGPGFVATMPGLDEPEVGLHAIVLFGYSDEHQVGAAQNSWGPNWGTNGRCWLSYEYISRYGVDAWTMEA